MFHLIKAQQDRLLTQRQLRSSLEYQKGCMFFPLLSPDVTGSSPKGWVSCPRYPTSQVEVFSLHCLAAHIPRAEQFSGSDSGLLWDPRGDAGGILVRGSSVITKSNTFPCTFHACCSSKVVTSTDVFCTHLEGAK